MIAMNKKFERSHYPKQMALEKIRSVILKFLDKHEATICDEDMSSEFWKQQLSDSLAKDLIESGLAITYLSVKGSDGQ